MTADSSTAALAHSGDEGGHSPSTRTSLPSPWAQVVRGGIDPDLISPAPSSAIADPVTAVDTQPEGGDHCNASGVVKSAWSKPSANGVVEGVTSPVMGAASWPALSESTRPGVKSVSVYSESSAKPIADGSPVVSQAPVVSQPQPKQVKQFTSNSHSNPNHNRQRSFKRGGSAGAASAGHSRPMPPTPPPLPPPFPFFDPYGNLVPQAVPVPPPPPFKGSNWSPGPVDHSLNRHPTQRNNFGPRPINNGYGGRHDNRGPRTPAARDVHIPQQIVPPPPPPPYGGFVRPPFVFPRPLRPFVAPMGYEMGASYVYFSTLAQAPYRGGAPVSSSGTSGSSLQDEILKQIEYYFSDDNLVKDNFLRSHMDEEGWVSINLIAGFRRVQALTNDTQMLLSSLKDSSTIEIQVDKVRRRSDWKKWINTPREVTDNSVEEASLQKLTLIDEPTNKEQVLANGDASIDDPCS